MAAHEPTDVPGVSTVVDGLVFPEGLLWHDDRLWLSDIHRHHVLSVDESGTAAVVAEVDDRPSGLGFTPEGRLLAVGLLDRVLYELRDGAAHVVVSLDEYSDKFANDMVTDGLGRSYVGCRNLGEPGAPTDCLVLVDESGRASMAAPDLVTPNGVVVTADLRTLIVAETNAQRLTSFTIDPDGSLRDRRQFAAIDGEPDGICLDAEGAVWTALPQESAVVRIRDGGSVAARIPFPDRWPFTCALGGDDGRTLFVAAGKSTMENFARLGMDRSLDHTSESRGWIYRVRVPVPGAGWP
jgi:sugar lactone lactonase YvrE